MIFHAYLGATSKIFALFYCVEMDYAHLYLAADFSTSCTTTIYIIHKYFAFLFVVLIPVGIPAGCGFFVLEEPDSIREHKGPPALANLYGDYKPDCPLLEIYQMLQKVCLIGLLSSLHRSR